jgi:hypothetical protein
MKKLLSLLVMLLAFTAMSFASKTLYLVPGEWSNDGAKFALYMFGGSGDPKFAAFTDSEHGYWTATLDDGYTKVIFIRNETGALSFDGKWNQSEDITLEDGKTVFTFASWEGGADSKSSFTASKLHKLYVQNKQTAATPRFASWVAATGYPWNGIEIENTETIDGKVWYYIDVPFASIQGYFAAKVGEEYILTGGQTFDFSTEDNLFYNFYPNNGQHVLASEALAEPAKMYVRTDKGTGGSVKWYHWNSGGLKLDALETETVGGVTWYVFETYKPSFSLQFYTYNNSEEDNDKTWENDYTFTSGETAYYFARLGHNRLKLENKYYIVYADGWQINPAENTVNAIEMTPKDDFEFTATLTPFSGGPWTFYTIASESIFDTETKVISNTSKTICPSFDADGNFAITKVEQHTCDVMQRTWKSWQIQSVDAKFDISFNFATMTWESKPYVEVTVTDKGYATYSHTDGLNIGEADAYIVSSADGYAKLEKIDEDANLPANTGIILKGEGTYKLYGYPYGAATADVSENLLVGSGSYNYNITGDFGEEADPRYYTGYILADGDNGVGFYKVKGDDNTLAAHKAFLAADRRNALAPSLMAPSFIGFGADVTGINEVKGSGLKVQDAVVYDLQGRRVITPARGLYIVNGRKVVIK